MIYTHVITALMAATLSATTAWQVQAWRFDTRIAVLEKGVSDSVATQARAALDDLAAAAANINKAAAAAQADNKALAVQLANFRKDLKNAKPLPADCKPDADRLRSLTRAVEATNAATARPVLGR